MINLMVLCKKGHEQNRKVLARIIKEVLISHVGFTLVPF